MSEDYSNTPSSMQNNSDSEAQPYGDAYTPLSYVEMPAHLPPSSNKQRTSSARQPAPPTEEDQLAATHQLGKVLKRYKSEPTAFTTDGLPSIPPVRRLAALRILIPMLFIVTLAIWFSTRTPPWPLIMICLLILAPWLANVFGRLPGDVIVGLQNAEFYLCANGLMIIKMTRVQAIRWEQIQTVQRTITRDLLRYSYILYLDEAESVTLDSSLVGPDLKELGGFIEREVSQRLLPDAIVAYEAGHVLNFGTINVTAQGLVLKKEENEEQSLPWERFVAIEDYNGYLITIKERKDIKEVKIVATWQKIEAENMLNISVLLPLVRHIENSLRANLQKRVDENATSEQPLVPPSEWSVYEYDTF